MKIVESMLAWSQRVFARGIAGPMLALLIGSVVCMVLVCLRVLWTDQVRYLFLGWNLFLAWVPLIFALIAWHEFGRPAGSKWRLTAWVSSWLLFFPNAPYILTDIVHLTRSFRNTFWIDMVLILLTAFTGLLLGFVSLYLMQTIVRRTVGVFGSWIFIALVAGLSGFGIYLGRFLRFNSWDLLVRPGKLYGGIGAWIADPFAHSTTYAFPALFATFLFVAYVMLYALTHLQPAEEPAR